MKTFNEKSNTNAGEQLLESQSRRTALGWLGKAALGSGVGVWLVGCGQQKDEQAAVCIDPSSLTPGEINLRESNGYVDVSAIPEKKCGNCVFFSTEGSDAPSGCGRCEIFQGIVSEPGYCASWAPKSA